jgi:filamentous hemagglutinin
MSDKEKSKALGGIVGGLVTGFGGPKILPTSVPIPGIQLLTTPEGFTIPVLTTTAAPAAVAGSAAGLGAAGSVAMMSGGGGDGGGSEEGDGGKSAAPEAARNAADAEKITNGHAYGKHASEFGNPSKQEFSDLVEDTMDNGQTRPLAKGRTAYWNDKNGMLVIKDPSSPDGGTAFKPVGGKSYFNNLK